ncbi:MAG TPA: cystathionine beta-lyase [Casimicrobiaceae bacterium]|jgi:cystathionine beta-lyase|nr:cystathionine beta-lyase [Casimicrobiaceae bacterium]
MSDDPVPGSKLRPATAVAHLGRDPKQHLGAVNTPVYRASTILFDSVADLEASERGEYPGITYGLHGLPTVRDLQLAVAALEGGHAALAVPSGLAAITLALLATTRPGDHVLVTDSVYGPTRRFCDQQLRRLGVEASYYDPQAGTAIEREIRPTTRVVFAESPGSLSFEVQDLPALAEVAHRRSALVLLDNTWATPLGFPAFARGADISVHAGTKYVGGHSDVLVGWVTCNERTFPEVYRLWTDMGITASSDDCFLALRGLRTLAVRLERHTQSALAIARWLRTRPEVDEVIFPALEGSRGHALWRRDFSGACGLFGVILKPVAKARVDAMLNGLRLFRMGWSWGGFESLIIPARPERTRSATRWQAPGPYLRLHVGLEDSADLIADLATGFERLRQ